MPRACLIAAVVLLSFAGFSAEAPVTYSKYCVSCGLRGLDTFASYSGQFVVHGSALPLPEQRNANTNKAPLVDLEPQTVAVTAERVKRALLDELGLRDLYRDKVHILLLDRAPPEQPIAMVSQVYLDGFQYYLGLPARIENSRFIKSLVQVALLEMANRVSSRSAELPAWLVEGMTQLLLTRVVPTSLANTRPIRISRGMMKLSMQSQEILGYDRLHNARALLRVNTCLTFHELSFGRVATPEQQRVYEACAQLFVHELLKLPNGPGLMGSFIAALPSALNWQTAFYRVYNAHFKKPLDTEKWWALSWINFKNREQHETWPLALSLQKLESLLLTSTEVRVSAESLPERREIPMQQLISGHDFAVHREIVAEKLQQLFFLSFNLAPEAYDLVSGYHAALQNYLEKRSTQPVQPGLKQDPEQRVDLLIKTTMRRLDELDRSRATLLQAAR